MNDVVSPSSSNRALGLLSGFGFIAIWSGFIVFSRMGVTGHLTPFDITFLRFAVGSIATLPFVYLYWPRHLPPLKILALVLTGPGAIYSLLMYTGLNLSPAAFAGVFSNATMPIFTAVYAWALLGERLNKVAWLAILIILAGSIAVGYESMRLSEGAKLAGLPYFIAASLILASYLVLLRRWNITAKQTLAIINLPNFLLYLPFWYFLFPSTIAEATTNEILFQSLFQGLGPGFLALIFFTYATQSLGPTPVAGFAATVPATAALLAIPILYEHLNLTEWTGVLAVTIGLAILIMRRH